jgi:predicted aspartyl protease
MIIEMREKFEGTVCRPVVTVKVNGIEREMRIDTGADKTVVDEELLRNIHSTKTLKVLGFDGKAKEEKVNIYPVTIEFDDRVFEIEAFGASRNCGLLGMDILSQCELHMARGICILEVVENEKI